VLKSAAVQVNPLCDLGGFGIQRIGDADIEQVELRRVGQPASLSPPPRLERESEQGVLEDLEVASHRVGRDPGLARDVGVVELLGVGQTHYLHKPGKGRDVARGRLSPL
jgi:hypothetical protein